MHVDECYLEGTVSQICYLGPSSILCTLEYLKKIKCPKVIHFFK